MVVLESTAGNRLYWKCKNPPNTVFMDKRSEELNIPPDVQGIWEYLPFRDDVFECVIFDPPHFVWNQKWKRSETRKGMIDSYGYWNNKREIPSTIYKALKEFHRVSKRLCFKWADTRDGSTLIKLTSLFRGLWKEIYKRSFKGTPFSQRPTHWVTFVRDD